MNLKNQEMKLQLSREAGWSLIETLAAIVIVGIGIAIFTRIQTMTRSGSRKNSDLLMAGHMIESDIDSLRTFIAKDTTNNWTTFIGNTSVTRNVGRIKLVRTLSTAYSPVPPGTIVVSNVKQVDFVASWGAAKLDTLRVTTYVAKRF